MTSHEPTGAGSSPTSCARCSCSSRSTDEQLDWLAEHGWVAEVPAGGTVFAEGEPAELLLVLLSGTVTMSRQVGADDVEIDAHRPARRLRRRDAGLPRRTAEPDLHRDRRGRSPTPAFLRCPPTTSATRSASWFPMAMHLLEGLFFGMRNSPADRRPAAAAARARRAVGRADPRAEQPGRGGGAGHRGAARAGRRHAAQAGDAGARRDRPPAARAARRRAGGGRAGGSRRRPKLGRRWRSPSAEDELTDWLDEHGVTGGWDLAPVFVAAGHRRRVPGQGRRRGRRPSCSSGGAALADLHAWRPSCCWPRSPTPSPGSPPWSAPRSSTPRWTGRRSSGSTCTTG